MTAAGHMRRVLVLDDDPTLHHLLGRLLRFHRFWPAHASSFAEGVDLARRSPFDAFLIDIGLRGPHSGLAFVEWVRRQRQFVQTPVTILTGIVSLSEEQEELIRQHRAYVFYKPERLALLIEHLQRVTT